VPVVIVNLIKHFVGVSKCRSWICVFN